MIIDRKFYEMPLVRNAGYTAHIREEDYRVIFARTEAPLRESSDSGEGVLMAGEELFAKFDEPLIKRQPRVGRSENKRTVTSYFVLTEQCNLTCDYCDVLGSASDRKPGQTMSYETARRGLEILLGRLDEEPELHAQVTFFGGEPLLAWKLLVRICEDIEEHPHRDRVARMLVTNGTLLDAEKAAFLRDHRVYVVVSLDGGPAVNDGMRSESYEMVAAGLDCLREAMPGHYGISCTVGSHNAARLSEEIRFLNERFRPLSIGLNIYHYQRDGSSPIAMDPDELGEALVEAYRTAREEKIAIYQFIGILKAFSRRYRNRDYCPACVDKLLFTPAGMVGRCETLMNDPGYTVPIESVRDHRLDPKLDWTAYTPEKEPDCQNCATRWICPGSCAYDMLVTTGKPQGVDPRRCSFHTRLLTEMLEQLLESSDGSIEEGITIPDQDAFETVVGGMPTEFPPDTIWIVSLSNVTAGEGF